MQAHFSPSPALRSQRDNLRSRQVLLSRPRAASQAGTGFDALDAAAMDCVTKRFPAFGDTPLSLVSTQTQRR
ncbi:MAG: hypothetical protein EOP70_00710 [Variovorax sp.]|jgi:hypothetical protein|nr:MAG: hypothetical protein EOP70_00710 [Variovorax sp.]